MPQQAVLDPDHDERRLSSDRSYVTPEYATYSTQSYARSDPYLVANSGTVPNPASFVRRQSGPAETGGTSTLLPLDQAVRLDRERTVRAASTTALPTWPNGHYGPTNPSSPSSSWGTAPFAPCSTSARAAGPTPPQQTPTRKLTKHRRSSSAFGRTAGPPSPTSLAHTPPHFSPVAPPSWQATYLYESAAAPRPHVTNPPYPPPSGSLPPNPSRAQSQQSMAQVPSPPQAGYHAFRPSHSLHLSPYPPVRPPLPSLPVRTESEEQQIERARRESLEAEQARVAALAAAEDHLLQLTLAESQSAAARERERDRLAASELRSMEEVIRASRDEEERRKWEQEWQRQAEEEAMARAIEASRVVVGVEDGFTSDKGKGKAYAPMHSDGGLASSEQDADEDEALELAMRLSLDEAARQHRWQRQAQNLQLPPSTAEDTGYTAAESSAQAFERYSRPSAPSSESANPSALSVPRRGMSLLDDELGVPAAEALDAATALPPPPAYEFPAHAAELDRPGDVIVGPGRPLPSTPFPSALPRPRPRPLPTPPILAGAMPSEATTGSQPYGRDESPASGPSLSSTTTAMRPTSFEEESHPALTPTDFEADPFDDRYEVLGVRWDERLSRAGTPFSRTDSTVSCSGGLGLFDAVVARRSSQVRTMLPGHQTVRGATLDGTDFATAPEPIPVSPVSMFPPAKSAPVSPLQGTDSFTAGVSPTSAVSAPTSPVPARGSIPSFGGYVEEGSAISASERILREVKWGFVDLDLSKSGRRPPLSYEGDFPRGAQLSLAPDPDGHQAYASFAVEAGTWQGLVVYLMWHGNSRFEAAPSDLERDKSGRGYRASVSLDFYRSPSSSNAAVSIRPPRVRARVTLLPLSDGSTRTSNSATLSPLAITVVSTPSFDAINPNIRLELSLPPTLPIALSSLASLLADAHAAARKTSLAPTSPAKSSRHGKAIASGPPPTAGQQALLNAIELFRKLGGDQYQATQGSHHHHHDEERSLLDRMKARLRQRKGPQLLPISNDDPSEGLPLPEGALLITPFPLDST